MLAMQEYRALLSWGSNGSIFCTCIPGATIKQILHEAKAIELEVRAFFQPEWP
jgi:hypothetical protein